MLLCLMLLCLVQVVELVNLTLRVLILQLTGKQDVELVVSALLLLMLMIGGLIVIESRLLLIPQQRRRRLVIRSLIGSSCCCAPIITIAIEGQVPPDVLDHRVDAWRRWRR